jgi:tetratricopeptide (TPR) repeat protein
MRLQGAELIENLRGRLVGTALDVTTGAGVRCLLAKELEASGAYEEGLEALGDLWGGVGHRPAVEGLEPRAAAELLMRAGALTGRFAKAKGIEGGQESAIDLISEGIRIFEGLGETEKLAEAWTEVGYCYWQKGEWEEARIALHTALGLLGDGGGTVRAVAIVRTAINENSAGRHYEAYRLLRAEGEFITSHEEHYISGLYHSTLANVLYFLIGDENQARAFLGEVGGESFADRALVEQTAAGFHFELAGHLRHAARVRNNTGYILFERGRFQEAHENLERAREIFRQLKDYGSAAQVDESIARVLTAEERYEEAEGVAREAVAALERGDDVPQLAQARTTLGRILARRWRYAQALEQLEMAVEAAMRCGDREGAGQACLTVIEELGTVLAPYDVWARYEQADELLSASQRPETIKRLRACAKVTLQVGRRALRTDIKDGWHGCCLEDEVLRYEGELIMEAMAAEGGHITRAARRLQTTHQALRNIISGRQKERLGHLYAPRPRRPKGGEARAGTAGH